MHEGGLDGGFFAVYVAPYYGEGARAVRRARTLVDTIRAQVARYPDRAGLARTAADVRRLARAGRAAVLLGLEGGHALAASPDTLARLADLGIRYVTLTHINTNRWADASQDAPRHGGLTAQGRALVRRMNDLGVLVDVSHASDATFYDALEASRTPVIASHSSARALTPGVRNLSDAMLRALARQGGVAMVNFFDAMVNPRLDAEVMAAVRARMDA
jgi:membrane dipeptidase